MFGLLLRWIFRACVTHTSVFCALRSLKDKDGVHVKLPVAVIPVNSASTTYNAMVNTTAVLDSLFTQTLLEDAEMVDLLPLAAPVGSVKLGVIKREDGRPDEYILESFRPDA
jgi:hypothetical protein